MALILPNLLLFPPLTFSTTQVRYGGIIGTGCHGAEVNSRSISDNVIRMQIVCANGELREFSDSKDAEEMSAARVNLGMLGIMYKITMPVKPMYSLRMVDTFPLMNDVINNPRKFKDLVHNSDSLEVFY